MNHDSKIVSFCEETFPFPQTHTIYRLLKLLWTIDLAVDTHFLFISIRIGALISTLIRFVSLNEPFQLWTNASETCTMQFSKAKTEVKNKFSDSSCLNFIDLSICYVFKCQTMFKFIKKHYFYISLFIYSFTLKEIYYTLFQHIQRKIKMTSRAETMLSLWEKFSI